MTRFYDAKDEFDLAAVEEILDAGGVEYSVTARGLDSDMKEICVAEEDVPFGEELLFLSKQRIFCSLPPSRES